MPQSRNSPEIAWKVMTILIGLEAIAGLYLTVQTILDFFSRGDDQLGAALSIVIVAVLSCLWVVLTAFGARSRKPWSRSSALTIQIFIAAIAIGAFQGFYAQPLIGWMLLVPAVTIFIAALLAVPATRSDSGAAGSQKP